MRRLPAILLLLSVTTFGTGALRYLHELEHAADHARDRAGHDHGVVDNQDHGHGHAGDDSDDHDHAHDGEPAHGGLAPDAPEHDPGPGHHPAHDPADCFVHSQLNLPLHDAGYVPVLVCVGQSVPTVRSLPAPAVCSRRPTLLLDSRGPPAGVPLPLQIVS